MPGTHKKGTNDADDNGKKGGSLPEEMEARVARLEEANAELRETMRRNGWTVKD